MHATDSAAEKWVTLVRHRRIRGWNITFWDRQLSSNWGMVSSFDRKGEQKAQKKRKNLNMFRRARYLSSYNFACYISAICKSPQVEGHHGLASKQSLWVVSILCCCQFLATHKSSSFKLAILRTLPRSQYIQHWDLIQGKDQTVFKFLKETLKVGEVKKAKRNGFKSEIFYSPPNMVHMFEVLSCQIKWKWSKCRKCRKSKRKKEKSCCGKRIRGKLGKSLSTAATLRSSGLTRNRLLGNQVQWSTINSKNLSTAEVLALLKIATKTGIFKTKLLSFIIRLDY